MAKKPIEVETLTHDATRKNIPTAEFESLMRDQDKTPIQLAYERRNRDLDPQLGEGHRRGELDGQCEAGIDHLDPFEVEIDEDRLGRVPPLRARLGNDGGHRLGDEARLQPYRKSCECLKLSPLRSSSLFRSPALLAIFITLDPTSMPVGVLPSDDPSHAIYRHDRTHAVPSRRGARGSA